MYYTDGSLQDPNASTAAVRGYYASGDLHYEERWFRGLRQDGVDGAAAIRKWRADGSLRHELHYERGSRSCITLLLGPSRMRPRVLLGSTLWLGVSSKEVTAVPR